MKTATASKAAGTTVHAPTVSPPGEPRPFAEEAAVAMGDLQTALRSVVERLPEPVPRAADLQRCLGLDQPLCWRIFKITSAPDPLHSARYIPTSGQMERVLAAAESKGVPVKIVAAARRAWDDFEEFVSRHAQDRHTFEAMIGAMGQDTDNPIDIKFRRSTFRGNAHIWGMQSAATTRCFVCHPGADSTSQDCIGINGSVRLQQLRHDAPMVLRHIHYVQDEPGPAQGKPKVRTAGADAFDALQFLREYSTSPLPEVRSTVAPDGTAESMLDFPDIGSNGAISLFMHQAAHVLIKGGYEKDWASSHLLATPTEVMVLDMLIPIGWSDPATASMATFGCRYDVPRARFKRDMDEIPLRVPVTHAANVNTVPPSPHVPRYPELIRHVLKERGWDTMRFDAYRCVIEYPVLHTLTSIRVDAVKR